MPSGRSTVIPDAWPRGMRDEIAAAYVGLSLTTFLREVAAGKAPRPTWITKGRKIWLKEKLDAWLDEKDGRPSTSVDGEDWMEAVGNEDRPALRSRAQG